MNVGDTIVFRNEKYTIEEIDRENNHILINLKYKIYAENIPTTQYFLTWVDVNDITM